MEKAEQLFENALKDLELAERIREKAKLDLATVVKTLAGMN